MIITVYPLTRACHTTRNGKQDSLWRNNATVVAFSQCHGCRVVPKRKTNMYNNIIHFVRGEQFQRWHNLGGGWGEEKASNCIRKMLLFNIPKLCILEKVCVCVCVGPSVCETLESVLSPFGNVAASLWIGEAGGLDGSEVKRQLWILILSVAVAAFPGLPGCLGAKAYTGYALNWIGNGI